jgi:hypothetical protein
MGHGQLEGDEHYSKLTDDVFDKVTRVSSNPSHPKYTTQQYLTESSCNRLQLEICASMRAHQKNRVFIGETNENTVEIK